MKRFAPLIFLLAVTCVTRAQTTTQSTLPDDELGKQFRSRSVGIQFNPPAGGAMIRELNSADIVRFVYPDSSWDVRVRLIPLHVPMELSAPPDDGVLELTASQLTNSNPTAQILRREVVLVHGLKVGLIEARYNSGIDRLFGQQAIFRDNDRRYLSVQMTAVGKPKDSPADQPDPQENRARAIFAKVIDSVRILDRSMLAAELLDRQIRTRGLWVLMDRKTITAALDPLHFMRIVRDGRDVGFIQVNERLARHNGNDGIEVIIHSRLEVEPPPVAAPAAAAAPAAHSDGVVIPQRIGPAVKAAAAPAQPQNLYASSIYFMTFDRDHEDWTSITQTDDQVASQLTESAYTDMTQRLLPNISKAVDDLKHSRKLDNNAPTTRRSEYILNVTYDQGKTKGKPVDIQLPPYYLPQAIGQMLPRLLPTDPAQYMFAFYVSGQRNLMGRYVDVLPPRDVQLDGQLVHAVPITDRIGVDGIATTHYVTRQGQWLGSVNDESKMVVLPTNLQTLKGIWPNFLLSPEPPPEDAR